MGSLDEEPVWITSDDARSDILDCQKVIEPTPPTPPIPPKPESPRCEAMLQITHPNRLVQKTGLSCLPSFKPELSFRLQQSWTRGFIFQSFNIWRPAPYFGTTLTRLGPEPVKLNNNDLIVTRLEEDSGKSPSSNTEAISFREDHVLAAIDIDRPGLLHCSVCFSNRGMVILNSERWKFNEIDMDYYQFSREINYERSNVENTGNSLMWMFYRTSRPELMDGIPKDLPFSLDPDTRICRLKRSISFDEPSVNASPPLAVMSRCGIVFCDGIEKNQGLRTTNMRSLILMTALAVAQYEKWLR